MKKSKLLKKELKLFDVFAIATGTTLSAGFFLLPGLAARMSGSAIVLAYMLAALPLIPAMYSIIELATAMPRAGGLYYFLDRTLGPLFGTIGGIGTWLALVLKVAFALIGMGAYIKIFFPELPMIPVAISLALLLGLLNYFGAKKSGMLQVYLVIGLLSVLALFLGGGVPSINFSHFNDFFEADISSILATTGLVYISYVGITKVASLSEEIKNPEKNLPRGLSLSIFAAILIYGLGTAVMVGVMPLEELQGSLTPAADSAFYFLGNTGVIIISIGALLAFISVANAGTMSASRYPLAMSRDHIMPRYFNYLCKRGTPSYSIMLTTGTVIAIIIFLDPTKIAKLASAFQLMLFAMACLAVIVIRESRIESYDPGFKSPFYPWMQLFGIFTSTILIFQMGWLPLLFSTGLVGVGVAWYMYYVRDKVYRSGAIYHVFERLGHQRHEGLDIELRGILKEKGLRKEDPFDEIIARSTYLEIERQANFEEITEQVSTWMSQLVPLAPDEIKRRFMEGTSVGATPVTHGIALPHFRCKRITQSELMLVRNRKGIDILYKNPDKDFREDVDSVYGIFYLVSPEDDPTQHLRILAHLAGHVDKEDFTENWLSIEGEQDIKELLLRDERFLSINISSHGTTKEILGKKLKEINVPKGCLVALLRRGATTIIPNGDTLLQDQDRLTVIGDSRSLNEFRSRFIKKKKKKKT